MLNYSVKLGDDNLKRDRLVWGEKYIAPDLSFISGVTSQDYHIEKQESIAASMGANTNFSSLKLSTENVTRVGYAVITKKKYKIKKDKFVNKATGESTEYHYADVNGVFYYIYDGDSTITVNNWLKEKWSKNGDEYHVDIVEGDVEAEVSGDYLLLNTIVWIEDDKVVIDGNQYIYDRYDSGIKYYEGGLTLSPEQITECEDITYNRFNEVSDYIYVTKFTLSKYEDKSVDIERIGFCSYYYFVSYKDNYFQVTGSNKEYSCKIPSELTGLSGEIFTVYSYTTLPDSIVQLKDYESYIIINGVNFNVEYILQDANISDEIGIYLVDDSHNFSVGDKVSIVVDNGPNSVPIYEMGEEKFILYNGTKYNVESNMANVVNINNVFYDVYYPNGTDDGVDAIVDINGDEIPMKIVETGTQLQRYGLVVLEDGKAAQEVKYEITTYDGVAVDGKTYRVNGDYIVLDKPVPVEFVVNSIVGSSLLVCRPSLNLTEFTDDFRNEMGASLCTFAYTNQGFARVYVQNKAFGTRGIKHDIGFVGTSKPRSSSDYEDVFNNLVLYVNSGYMYFKIPLVANVASNTIQADTVKRDFIDVEREKAINPIVDMEKDVYTPKYFNGVYSGSSTDFFPVNEIDVNLHFRTRNMDNWKVNESYNNLEVSASTDNWFCTDYYPYRDIISADTKVADIIQDSSDLIGLLWFTDDDVFYQRDKIGKSFLRFSYYDSTDPNTQSLLATSTVFVNEHSLYKKFIDNSRRNVNNFAIVQEPEFKRNEYGNIDPIPGEYADGFNGKLTNRISVTTEFYGTYNKNKKVYYAEDFTGSTRGAHIVDDDRRISSRLVINNKYETDTSSEGFYLYIFREYSENLHPKAIYMKVEFNHAGVGRTIPFIIPMHWGDADENGERTPERPLRLASGSTDIEELKAGIPLSHVYAQTYIPLYAVYDFKNKEYAYVFDNRYVSVNDNKVSLSLFELKISNDESNSDAEKARKNIRNNKIEKAVVNVNTSQFDKTAFIGEVV